MRIAANVVSVILVLLGLLWIVQGSNLMPDTAMSGQSMWLWIGVVVLIVGAVGLWWANRRRTT
jgi:LPXTG-motif cell wall-anchored protein